MFSNLTTDQINKRNQLKTQIDKFASFIWQGHNMFDEYGMFIINEKKGGLKFYNGPSFSNEYSKPQFQEGMNNLLGVNINTQTIELQVGIYYFTIAEYRELLKLFGPYEIGDLIFSFNPNWRYKVKLKNMADSPRYILNSKQLPRENHAKPSPNSKVSLLQLKPITEYYYYTEWKLIFEVQGPNCLLAVDPYEWKITQEREANSSINYVAQLDDTINDNYHEANNIMRSDLEVPLDIYWSIPTNLLNSDTSNEISLYIQVPSMQNKIVTEPLSDPILLELFKITLDKLPQSDLGGTYLNLHYMSEQGLLFWSTDNTTEQLLTLRSSRATGKRLVTTLKILRYMLPADTNLTGYKLIFKPIESAQASNTESTIINIESYARTNAI